MDAYARWMAPIGFRARLRRLLNAKERAAQADGKRALAILRLLGLFDRPAAADCLAALQQVLIPHLTETLVEMSEQQRNIAFARLESAKLLTVSRDGARNLVSLDAHPLVREYFARQLRAQDPEAWRAAHRRIYEHLSTTTQEEANPSLDDLQPLYQAVAHGCQAALYVEAYKLHRSRIAQDDRFYSGYRLGAYGAELGVMGGLFQEQWTRVHPVIPKLDQARLLFHVGYALRASGDLSAARAPLNESYKLRCEAGEWKLAGISARALSILHGFLGDLTEAIRWSERAVELGERTDIDAEIYGRVILAEALFHAGRDADAKHQVQVAEGKQAGHEPDYPLLYWYRGYRYCEMLLAGCERESWRHHLGLSLDPRLRKTTDWRDVEGRMDRTSSWAGAAYSQDPMNEALTQLILGRCKFFEAVLTGDESLRTASMKAASDRLDAAVAGIRSAGVIHHLPSSLLARAWLRFLNERRTGPESAQSDLGEAWEIAERGPMPLFLADIHLYRARLFHAVTPYPWATDASGRARGPKDDLAAARHLIEKDGYWRRKEELEDAERASAHW
jgi:hypothetical protein